MRYIRSCYSLSDKTDRQIFRQAIKQTNRLILLLIFPTSQFGIVFPVLLKRTKTILIGFCHRSKYKLTLQPGVGDWKEIYCRVNPRHQGICKNRCPEAALSWFRVILQPLSCLSAYLMSPSEVWWGASYRFKMTTTKNIRTCLTSIALRL